MKAVVSSILLTSSIACFSTAARAQGVAIDVRDYCDPVTFATIGCSRDASVSGAITFNGFVSELTADRSVGAWRFAVDHSAPAQMANMITATNKGGEVHTFTAVKEFGGGIVPFLNAASGNPTPAPECTQGNLNFLAPGQSQQVSSSNGKTMKFQCCIHPWMRIEVKLEDGKGKGDRHD